VEAAQAERARRVALLAVAERQADADVESARVGVDAAERRLAAEEKRVSAAAAAVDDARLRLAAGTAPPIEVTEAQTTLARAQTDATTARFEAARARVRLAFAAGQAYPEAIPALAGGALGQ
jgi:outer membrane protein TolC